mgnify:CR=1 FL=1
MVLVTAWRTYPNELRADLQRYYGIDIDHAMQGEHSAEHLAALVSCLPSDAALCVAVKPDAAWTREAVILAELRNMFASYIYGMSDKRKRGNPPKPIGPSWMTKKAMRSLEARLLTIDELMAELQKPRGCE